MVKQLKQLLLLVLQYKSYLNSLFCKSKGIKSSLKDQNGDIVIENNQLVTSLDRLKTRLEEIGNITKQFYSFNKTFDELLMSIQSSLDYFDSTVAPHSKDEFDEIMRRIDKLANDTMKRVEKIKEETKEWKKESQEIGKVVETIMSEQSDVFETLVSTENNFFESNDKINAIEDKISLLNQNNKKTAELLQEVRNNLNVIFKN